LLGIADDASPHQRWEQNLDRLDDYLRALQQKDPIAQMDGQIRKRRTLEAIKRILLRESLNQPLMVIFEDLHWIDEQTQEFLNLFVDSIANTKILLLVNYRPEYAHQWGSKTWYTQLRLDPLGKASADEMLSALLGDDPQLAALKQTIIARTEGNPFFMEETVQVLLDEGALQREGAEVRLTKPLHDLKIPPTVQAILAARIDRLPADAKDLLQTLSVIGREFPLSLIRAVVPKPVDELERILGDLQLGEFTYEQPAIGDTEYIFKHALTQEVAYGSVLMERRRTLHERIGAAIEASSRENIEDHLSELARHYARSANAAKAVEYCLRACKQSSERASYAESLTNFETGLTRLQELPDDDRRAELELDLRNTVHQALITITGYGSVAGAQSALRALELSRRPGIDWAKTWAALRAVFYVHEARLDLRKAAEIGAEMVTLAEQHGSTELLADSTNSLARARMFLGDFELAQQGYDRTWALLESLPKPSTPRTLQAQASTSIVAAWNLWFLGYPDRALQQVRIATSLAIETGSKTVMEEVHNFATYVYVFRREPERLRERANATLELSADLGNPFRGAMSEISLGWADVTAGDVEVGIARMRRYGMELKAAGSEAMMDYWLAAIASALATLERFDEGLGTIQEAFPIIEKTGGRCNEAEVHRLKGELLLAQQLSNIAQAEQSFRIAIEIAREQKAKSWELRATMSLARLLRDSNRRDEARAMLTDIHSWFTEGFDTADLKDAKALLDDIS
jgi:tetratricopeptide (TPR) repeat protein